MVNFTEGIFMNALLASTGLMMAYCQQLKERVSVRTAVCGSYTVNLPLVLAALSTLMLVVSVEASLVDEQDAAVLLADLSDQLLVVTYLVRCAQVFTAVRTGRIIIHCMMVLSCVATVINTLQLCGVELPGWLELCLELAEAFCFTSVLAVFVYAKVVAGHASDLSGREIWRNVYRSRKIQAAFVLVVHEPLALLAMAHAGFGDDMLWEGLALLAMHVAAWVSEHKTAGKGHSRRTGQSRPSTMHKPPHGSSGHSSGASLAPEKTAPREQNSEKEESSGSNKVYVADATTVTMPVIAGSPAIPGRPVPV